jgi:hypothetical protein
MLAAATTSSFSYHQTTFRNQGTYYLSNLGFLPATVFRILDILRRIRILGSVQWLPDLDSAIWSVIFKKQIKNIGFFCLFLTVPLTSACSTCQREKV